MLMPFEASWYIELCERPVKKARSVDKVLFGRALSHPFLALTDQYGNVHGEIHLVPFDRSNNTRRTQLNRLFELSTAVTVPLGLDKMLRRMIKNTRLNKYYPTLHSRFYNEAKQYPEASQRQIIISGGKRHMLDHWRALRGAAAEVDLQSLPYDRFGWGPGRNNCQSGLTQTMENAGLHVIPLSGRYAAPGWHNT